MRFESKRKTDLLKSAHFFPSLYNLRCETSQCCFKYCAQKCKIRYENTSEKVKRVKYSVYLKRCFFTLKNNLQNVISKLSCSQSNLNVAERN